MVLVDVGRYADAQLPKYFKSSFSLSSLKNNCWENGIETCIISCMKQSPVQVRCTILDAWGWCTGTTQRDGMRREEGSGWGTQVYLWWIHFDIWQN